MMQVMGPVNIHVKTMTPEQFVFWLQGFIEMADPKTLTEAQTAMLKEHLGLVFNKKTHTLADLQTVQKLPPESMEEMNEALRKIIEDSHTGTPMPKPPYTVTCAAVPPREDGKPHVFIC